MATAPARPLVAQAPAARPDSIPQPIDWPQRFGALRFNYSQWLIDSGARERLRTAPASPATIVWLSRAQRGDAALTVLERVADEHPEQMARAFDAFQDVLLWDQSRGYRERILAILEVARARLRTLPREQQAAAARAILPLEDRTDGASREYADRLRRFVATYAGTAAADLATVDLVTAERISMASIAALDDLAAKHPGTDVAAKALSLKAFHLSRNAFSLGLGTPESDPTDRLLDVLRIARDLESGIYPQSSWVERAPELVTGFPFYRVKMSPANAERVLAELVTFVRAHTHLLDAPDQRERFLWMLSSPIPDVALQTNDGEAALARALEEIERATSDPALVRYARAERFLTPSDGAPSPDARTAAAGLLAEAATMGTGTFARRALAQLAELDFSDQRFAQARDRFAAFLQRYPASDFAWMAALRRGQSEAALGTHDRAAPAFVEAAERFGAVPFARVLGNAYAAQALEVTRDFDQALGRYRDALSAWTVDLGDRLGANRPLSLEQLARMEPDPAVLLRDDLVRRVDQLSAFLPLPGGHDLEHGRSLLLQGRAREAVPVLEDVARQQRATAVGAEATATLHRARLEAALALADTANPAADPGGALIALDALSREPFDTSVGIAAIAAATIRMLDGNRADADARMHAALQRWVPERTRVRTSPAPGTIEADTLAVRDAVLLPRGGGLLGTGWNAQDWPGQLPAYLVAPSELRVTVPGVERPLRVDVSRQPPDLSNVVFMAPEDVAYLSRVIPRLGGARTRVPTAIMEVPNQPIGDARSIVQWWDGFFPARPGHWGGFEILTYPSFSTIEFTDAGRTRALVPVTVGYSGATVVLEKIDGVWTMREILNRWIT